MFVGGKGRTQGEYKRVNLSEEITPGTSLQPSIALRDLCMRDSEGWVVAFTEEKVFAVSFARCWQASTCENCLELNDPHCSWNPSIPG